MADTIRAIEAQIAALRHHIEQIGEDAREQAWYIEHHGLNIGTGENRLFTGGPGQWEAPKVHPVWAPELEHEANTLERLGAPTFEYEPTRDLLRQSEEARGLSYAGLDDLREDRAEYREVQELAQLHDRIDALQQAQQPEHSHEHGMGY